MQNMWQQSDLSFGSGTGSPRLFLRPDRRLEDKDLTDKSRSPSSLILFAFFPKNPEARGSCLYDWLNFETLFQFGCGCTSSKFDAGTRGINQSESEQPPATLARLTPWVSPRTKPEVQQAFFSSSCKKGHMEQFCTALVACENVSDLHHGSLAFGGRDKDPHLRQPAIRSSPISQGVQ